MEPVVNVDPNVLSLDLTPYKRVYISYGSSQREDRYMQDRPDFLLLMGVFPIVCISIDTDYPTYTQKEYEYDNPSEMYTLICVPTKSVAETIEITRQLLSKLTLIESLNPKNVFFANFIKYRRPNKIDEDTLEQLKELSRIVPLEYNYYDWCGFLLPYFIKKRKLSILSYKDVSVNRFLKELDINHKLADFSKALMRDNELREFADSYMKSKVKGEILYNSIRKCLLCIIPSMTQDQYDMHLNVEKEQKSEQTAEIEQKAGKTRRKRVKRRTKSYRNKYKN
jgi:hypothetical protein